MNVPRQIFEWLLHKTGLHFIKGKNVKTTTTLIVENLRVALLEFLYNSVVLNLVAFKKNLYRKKDAILIIQTL